MAKVKISEFNSNPALNTDIDSINISEGCAPSGINDAIRELMSQLKDWQSGTSNDPYVVGSSGSLTLNQGTANTVPYLNGSKVVTSGTALSFDGTNLGLGVTPSAWSYFKAAQVGVGSLVAPTNASNTVVYNNAYYNGSSELYITSNAASQYQQLDGAHIWKRASSGTAGNAITFTQAMTLDASGNLGVGTTSPNTRLHITGNDAQIHLEDPRTTGDGSHTVSISAYKSFAGYNNLILEGSSLQFKISGTERARIDSSGDLILANGFGIGNISADPAGKFFIATAALSAGASTYPLKWNSSTGFVTYDTSSRLVKTNIVDSPYGLAQALQIQARQYIRVDSGQTEVGLIADEVAEVMPEFVPMVAKSVLTGNEEDTELVHGGVNYDKLTAVLFKAIQEQQAIIESLTTRITALEGQ